MFLAPGAQQFDLHAQFADAPVGLIEPQLRRIVVGADLQGRFQAAERLGAPFLQPWHRHGRLAAEGIQRLAAQQAQHDFGFAFRAPAQRGSFQAGAPGGSASWTWSPITSQAKGHTAIFQILTDGIKIGGVRMSGSANFAQAVADKLGAPVAAASVLV